MDLAFRRRSRRALLRASLAALVSWLGGRVLARLTGKPRRGKSAATSAMASGVALEFPALGVPAAALVARRNRHDPAGVAAGVAAAALTTRFWPLAPAEPAEVPAASVPRDLTPGPDGEGLVVVINTDSGTAEEDLSLELKRELPEAEIRMVETVEGSELRKALDDAAERASAIGVAGGDGSINTAAQIALDHDKPLFIVPSGTFNHLSHALGIGSAHDAIAAVKKGRAVEMDVATIDGHVFLNTASFGSYVTFVDAREKLEARIGKWPAVLIALLRVLRKAEPVDVEIDDVRHSVWMAFIGNCRYRPSGFAPTWRERLDDGKIDLRYVDGAQPWARLRLVAAVLTGRLGRSKVYQQTLVDEFVLTPVGERVRLARDGETFEGSEEIRVRKLPQRLTVFVDHEDAS